tara:strand:- start:5431 stop:6000 length:570 start_codon:yes stop_codon:yes gene_type:complete
MADVKALRIPGKASARGRATSINGAFANAILPRIEPTLQEKQNTLEILNIDAANVTCAYCGDPATEWDHLYPTVMSKKPTGWGTEAANLVPACGKCNQSKGNKHWETWMSGPAVLSPTSRKIPATQERINALKNFVNALTAFQFEFTELEEESEWEQYWKIRDEIILKLQHADELAAVLRQKLITKTKI